MPYVLLRSKGVLKHGGRAGAALAIFCKCASEKEREIEAGRTQEHYSHHLRLPPQGYLNMQPALL